MWYSLAALSPCVSLCSLGPSMAVVKLLCSSSASVPPCCARFHGARTGFSPASCSRSSLLLSLRCSAGRLPAVLVHGDFPLLAAVRRAPSLPISQPGSRSCSAFVSLLAGDLPSVLQCRAGLEFSWPPPCPIFHGCAFALLGITPMASSPGVHPLRLLAVDLPFPASSSLRLFALACAAPLRSSRRSSTSRCSSLPSSARAPLPAHSPASRALRG